MATIPDPATTEWVPIWNPVSEGPVGPVGPQGVQGVQGDQGVQGVKGDTGAKGDKGDLGNTGAQGPIGVQGPQGETGPEGPVGPESDEIFVGPADPGVASYDMWYDTDATPLPAGGTGHGSAHNAGGSDPITAISAGIVTTGTLVDTRLSANVALRGAANTFTFPQTFNGDLVTNGRIEFPAAQNASSGANSLDDYEEGSWAPAWTGNGSPTGSSGIGRYMKVGRLVWAGGRLSITGPGTYSGLAMIGGFPFVSDGATYWAVSVSHWGAAVTAYSYMAGLMYPASAYCDIRTITSPAIGVATLTGANMGAFDIIFSLSYIAA